MVKINREEYKFLKNLDDKWKWIARNRDGGLYKFQETPEKIDSFRWNDRKQTWLGIYGNLFQFVQWEDEEPYNIQELIDEYLDDEYGYFNMKLSREFEEFIKKESEETELKDSEWLKKEIHKELEAWHGVEGGIDGDGINEIMLLINKHEESEVKRLDKKIKELDSYNDELVRDNNQFRNELDSQEVLSQEWLDNNSVYASADGVTEEYIHVDDLQTLIVPKQELPVAPTWFDEWWRDVSKGAGSLFHNIDRFYDELFSSGTREMYDYISSPDNKQKLLNIIVNELDYVIEEEQKYIVSDNSSIPLLIKNDSGEIMSYDSQIAYNNPNGTIELTEKEIKDYDPRYMTFAKPVEEIEK